MNTRPDRQPAGHYELRIDGHLGEHWSTWFDGLSLTHADDGTTILRGPVTDQAELHGLIAKVRDLGATLLAVNVVDADSCHFTSSPHSTSPDGATP